MNEDTLLPAWSVPPSLSKEMLDDNNFWTLLLSNLFPYSHHKHFEIWILNNIDNVLGFTPIELLAWKDKNILEFIESLVKQQEKDSQFEDTPETRRIESIEVTKANLEFLRRIKACRVALPLASLQEPAYAQQLFNIEQVDSQERFFSSAYQEFPKQKDFLSNGALNLSRWCADIVIYSIAASIESVDVPTLMLKNTRCKVTQNSLKTMQVLPTNAISLKHWLCLFLAHCDPSSTKVFHELHTWNYDDTCTLSEFLEVAAFYYDFLCGKYHKATLMLSDDLMGAIICNKLLRSSVQRPIREALKMRINLHDGNHLPFGEVKNLFEGKPILLEMVVRFKRNGKRTREFESTRAGPSSKKARFEALREQVRCNICGRNHDTQEHKECAFCSKRYNKAFYGHTIEECKTRARLHFNNHQ